MKPLRYDSNLYVDVIDDPYLSEKTGTPHFKFRFQEADDMVEAGKVAWLKEATAALNGVVFAEIDASFYGLAALLQGAGFRLVCPSMIWTCRKVVATDRGSCRIVSAGTDAEQEHVIMNIAHDFDTSHYAQFPRYQPVLEQMYVDKTMLEWRRSGEIIGYSSSGGEIGAITTLGVDGREGRLLTSCVSKKHRGGRAYHEMIAFGTRYLLETKKVDTVVVECIASNIVVQKAWTTLGYRPSKATIVLCFEPANLS